MADSANTGIRVGLIGYGLAGSAFHAPLIQATTGLALAVIVTSDADKTEAIQQRYPATEVVADVEALWALSDRLDLVVIASPNASHAPLAHAALAAGLPVVLDKPLAANSADAQAVIDDANTRGLALTVFHNRRWDADFLTVQRLIQAGDLGDIRRFESRFERWRPEAKPGWRRAGSPEDAGGLLFDLGSHLIDQALTLFGDVRTVYAELDPRYEGSAVDDDSFLALNHHNGVRSHLWMSSVTPQLGPRFRVLGSQAGYTTYGLDPQEAALRAGNTPDTPGFGEEARTDWGQLGTVDNHQTVPSETGHYGAFYAGVARALLEGSPMPVDPADGLRVLAIIEAAQRSAAEGQVVILPSASEG